MSDHGYSRYNNAGCRCDVCREGKRVYMAARRAKARARADRAGGLVNHVGRYVSPTAMHGTVSGYQEQQCRCRACTAAANAAVARWRATQLTPAPATNPPAVERAPAADASPHGAAAGNQT